MVGIGTATCGAHHKGVVARLGDKNGARGFASRPEVGVGTIGSEKNGVDSANGSGTTDESRDTGSLDVEGAQTAGCAGVGKRGEEESVVGHGS